LFRLLFKLAASNNAKFLAAENLVLRQQLLVISRKYKRAPKLTGLERLLLVISITFIKPVRILKTATLLKFHTYLIQRKYQLLYSKKIFQKPGPKGPSKEIVQLILQMKQRNPRFGARRIAMQILNIFGILLTRMLSCEYLPNTISLLQAVVVHPGLFLLAI